MGTLADNIKKATTNIFDKTEDTPTDPTTAKIDGASPAQAAAVSTPNGKLGQRQAQLAKQRAAQPKTIQTAERLEGPRTTALEAEQVAQQKAQRLEQLGTMSTWLENQVSNLLNQPEQGAMPEKPQPPQQPTVPDPGTPPPFFVNGMMNPRFTDWQNRKTAYDNAQAQYQEQLTQYEADMQQYEADVAGTQAGTLANKVLGADDLMVSDVNLTDLGMDTNQLESLIPGASGMSLTQLQQAVEEMKASELSNVENLRSQLSDPMTSEAEKEEIRNALKDMGAVGLTGSEAGAAKSVADLQGMDEDQLKTDLVANVAGDDTLLADALDGLQGDDLAAASQALVTGGPESIRTAFESQNAVPEGVDTLLDTLGISTDGTFMWDPAQQDTVKMLNDINSALPEGESLPTLVAEYGNAEDYPGFLNGFKPGGMFTGPDGAEKLKDWVDLAGGEIGDAYSETYQPVAKIVNDPEAEPLDALDQALDYIMGSGNDLKVDDINAKIPMWRVAAANGDAEAKRIMDNLTKYGWDDGIDEGDLAKIQNVFKDQDLMAFSSDDSQAAFGDRGTFKEEDYDYKSVFKEMDGNQSDVSWDDITKALDPLVKSKHVTAQGVLNYAKKIGKTGLDLQTTLSVLEAMGAKDLPSLQDVQDLQKAATEKDTAKSIAKETAEGGNVWRDVWEAGFTGNIEGMDGADASKLMNTLLDGKTPSAKFLENKQTLNAMQKAIKTLKHNMKNDAFVETYGKDTLNEMLGKMEKAASTFKGQRTAHANKLSNLRRGYLDQHSYWIKQAEGERVGSTAYREAVAKAKMYSEHAAGAMTRLDTMGMPYVPGQSNKTPAQKAGGTWRSKIIKKAIAPKKTTPKPAKSTWRSKILSNLLGK